MSVSATERLAWLSLTQYNSCRDFRDCSDSQFCSIVYFHRLETVYSVIYEYQGTLDCDKHSLRAERGRIKELFRP